VHLSTILCLEIYTKTWISITNLMILMIAFRSSFRNSKIKSWIWYKEKDWERLLVKICVLNSIYRTDKLNNNIKTIKIPIWDRSFRETLKKRVSYNKIKNHFNKTILKIPIYILKRKIKVLIHRSCLITFMTKDQKLLKI